MKQTYTNKDIITSIIEKESSNPKKYAVYYCDFETILIDNCHHVICFSIVGDKISNSNNYFYMFENEMKENQHTNTTKVIENCELLTEKFVEQCRKICELEKTTKTDVLFYFHNFGRFDSIFLLKCFCGKDLFNGNDIDTIIRNNVIYKITLKDKEQVASKRKDLIFKDTYLALPLSLMDISETFCNKNKKTDVVLAKSIEDLYDQEKMEKITDYCINDTFTLQEGFNNYMKYISEILNIDPWPLLSLPSMTLRSFRKNYYDDKSTPIGKLSINKDAFVRDAYLGGIVDVYKPLLEEGYHYDVNSLYPTVMAKNKMPLGTGTFIEGEKININNFFGFIKAKVIINKEMYIPYLSIKTEDNRIINPIGEFEGTFFSEEIKYAKSLGYNFIFKKGLSFEKGNLFKNFVERMYNLRKKETKKSPGDIILKLILNSLYGRFGLNPGINRVKIIDYDENILNEYLKKYEISDFEKLGNRYIITYKDGFCEEKEQDLIFSGEQSIEDYEKNKMKAIIKNKDLNYAVQIAAATTAYARIYMHKLKNQENIDIYYSDTDSIFCKQALPKKIVSKKRLGALKLEGKIIEGLFIAPKIYYIKYENGKEVMKCKGISNEKLNKEDFYVLYKEKEGKNYENNNNFKRSLKNCTITSEIKNIHISGNLLKREKIYDRNNMWIDTKPIKLNICNK